MLMSVVKNDVGKKGAADILGRAAKKKKRKSGAGKIIKHDPVKRLFLGVCKQLLWPLIPQRRKEKWKDHLFSFSTPPRPLHHHHHHLSAEIPSVVHPESHCPGY